LERPRNLFLLHPFILTRAPGAAILKAITYAAPRLRANSMKEGIIIKQFYPEDLGTLAAAFPDVGLGAADAAAHAAREMTIVIAWLDDAPAGIGMIRWAGPRDPGAAAAFPSVPELLRLFVRKEFRRQGVGSLLVKFLEDIARIHGAKQIGLGVGIDNKAARRLYEALGYVGAALSEYTDGGTPDGDRCSFLMRQL
jgi:GNAT superfamily N-acetyltransferase